MNKFIAKQEPNIIERSSQRKRRRLDLPGPDLSESGVSAIKRKMQLPHVKGLLAYLMKIAGKSMLSLMETHEIGSEKGIAKQIATINRHRREKSSGESKQVNVFAVKKVIPKGVYVVFDEQHPSKSTMRVSFKDGGTYEAICYKLQGHAEKLGLVSRDISNILSSSTPHKIQCYLYDHGNLNRRQLNFKEKGDIINDFVQAQFLLRTLESARLQVSMVGHCLAVVLGRYVDLPVKDYIHKLFSPDGDYGFMTYEGVISKSAVLGKVDQAERFTTLFLELIRYRATASHQGKLDRESLNFSALIDHFISWVESIPEDECDVVALIASKKSQALLMTMVTLSLRELGLQEISTEDKRAALNVQNMLRLDKDEIEAWMSVRYIKRSLKFVADSKLDVQRVKSCFTTKFPEETIDDLFRQIFSSQKDKRYSDYTDVLETHFQNLYENIPDEAGQKDIQSTLLIKFTDYIKRGVHRAGVEEGMANLAMLIPEFDGFHSDLKDTLRETFHCFVDYLNKHYAGEQLSTKLKDNLAIILANIMDEGLEIEMIETGFRYLEAHPTSPPIFVTHYLHLWEKCVEDLSPEQLEKFQETFRQGFNRFLELGRSPYKNGCRSSQRMYMKYIDPYASQCIQFVSKEQMESMIEFFEGEGMPSFLETVMEDANEVFYKLLSCHQLKEEFYEKTHEKYPDAPLIAKIKEKLDQACAEMFDLGDSE